MPINANESRDADIHTDIRKHIFDGKKFSFETKEASTLIIIDASTTRRCVDVKKSDERKELRYDIVFSQDETSLCMELMQAAIDHKNFVLEKIKRRILNGGDRLWETLENVPNGVGGKYCEDLKSSLCWEDD